MSASGQVTCSACGAHFPFEEMTPEAPEEPEEQNTQFGWLVAGRCPSCGAEVELTLAEVQRLAGQ